MTRTFTAADQRHLSAAQGYVDLTMYLEANDELELIAPELRAHPEVLMIRLAVYSGLQRWELMRFVARQLTRVRPNEPQWFLSWAEATCRAAGAQEACVILQRGIEIHPSEASVHFHLARYLCLCDRIEESKAVLKRCFELEPAYRSRALDDNHLEPVWRTILPHALNPPN